MVKAGCKTFLIFRLSGLHETLVWWWWLVKIQLLVSHLIDRVVEMICSKSTSTHAVFGMDMCERLPNNLIGRKNSGESVSSCVRHEYSHASNMAWQEWATGSATCNHTLSGPLINIWKNIYVFFVLPPQPTRDFSWKMYIGSLSEGVAEKSNA